MKVKFLFGLMLVLLFFGCGENRTQYETRRTEEAKEFHGIRVDFDAGERQVLVNTVIIDSCEYLYGWFGSYHGGGSFTHKGNCKFCAERNRKTE